MLPSGPHVDQRATDFLGRNFWIGTTHHKRSFPFGGFQQLHVPDDIRDSEVGKPSLAGAKEFARTAQLQIEFGDFEAVIRAHHGVEAALTLFGHFPSCHQDAV